MELNVIKSGLWGTCLWGIDDTGFLIVDEGVATSISNSSDVPWDDCRNKITEVEFTKSVSLPEGASLKGLFRDCTNLEKVNLSGLNTSEVVDMSSMFENCINLKDMSLVSFNTEKVKDMSNMFCGCRNLSILDLSTFNTTETDNMINMFGKCNKLYTLTLGDRFSTVGSGKTNCGNLTIKNTGRYRMAKVVNVIGGSVYYHENRASNNVIEKQSMNGLMYEVEPITFDQPGEKYQFLGWNSMPDGSGKYYHPGDEIENMEEDIDLYAIWVCAPIVGELAQPQEIEYGSPLIFDMPEAFSESPGELVGYIEINSNGDDRLWQRIDKDAILPVSYNGYMMRLAVSNDYGTAYSNPVYIKIRKSTIDITSAHWVSSDSMIYDGTEKSVWLEGLPKEVTAVYEENTAVDAGNYVATVTLEYDSENYDIPVRVKPYHWSIEKAVLDMSHAKWSYEEAFTYDGKEKTVELEGVPESATVIYENNVATDADIMTAVAHIEYDETNYERPIDIAPCVWEIKKAFVDSSGFEWTSCDDFVYDGTPKRVEITNLPEGAEIELYGAEEVLAGRYLTRARLSGNYYTNGTIEYEWEIKKARYNMIVVHWSYSEPVTYDNNLHEVTLVNVPTGLSVKYYGNVGMDAGDYNATASFVCADPHNYETPQDMSLNWTIKKAVADMSNVRWDYVQPFVYDGEAKSVDLAGLPSGVFAVIDNGTALNAGVYIAHAQLRYDEHNVEVEQPADCQWQIVKAKFDVSDVHWSYDEPFTYDGNEKVVNLVNIPDGLNVEYRNNVKLDAGKYVATAKLTPSDIVNYEIPEVNGCTWSINKSVLDKFDIVWSDDDDFVYDGSVKSVRIVSEINDKIKVEYSGADESDAGEHEAVATFYPTDVNNYEAPTAVKHKWSIRKGDFSLGAAVWNYAGSYVYDGKRKEVKIIDLPEGLIVNYENNAYTEVGEYLAVANFEIMDSNNYNELDPASLKWEIRKSAYDMSNVRWQDETTFAYDESEKTVYLEGLPKGITPVYEGNSATVAGEYLASVEFEYDEHNYEKPVFEKCRWTIEKSVLGLGKAKWNYTDSFVYDGTEKTVKLVDLPAGTAADYSNAVAINAGTYYASANLFAVNDINYTVAHAPDLTWKIEKGNYDMSEVRWDYDECFTYDGTEKRIELKGLPEGVFPVYMGNTGLQAGDYSASVTFKVADPENYNIPTFPGCQWMIQKADFDMSLVKWDYVGPFTYDGSMKEIVLRNIPQGLKANYSGNCAVDVGTYKADVEFQLFDNVNYNVPTFKSCTWGIIKADFDMSAVCWEENKTKIYNGRVQGIYLENLPNGITVKYLNNEATVVGRYTATAELTIEDSNNYNIPSVSGCDWEIMKADIDMSQIRWNYTPGTFVYDGGNKRVTLENLPDCVTANYTGNAESNAGKYIATAEFAVKDANYNVPEPVTLDWFIDRAECDMRNVRWNYSNEFVYDGKTHGIEVYGLPNYVKVTYEENQAVGAGEYLAVAKFAANNENYNKPDDMTCSWVINKANCDISSIRWSYDQPFVYDASDKTIILDGVPKELTVSYEENIANEVGCYLARAEFAAVDEANYNVPDAIECEWNIIKANYDMSGTKWSSNRFMIYSGGPQVILIEGYPDEIRPVYTGNTGLEVGDYIASVKFEYDTRNYNEPIIEDCEWAIVKNSFDMSNAYWDYSQAFVYDGSDKRVELCGLPEGVTPVYSGNVAAESGDYVADVVFEYDEENFEMPYFEPLNWTIEKAEIPIDFTKFGWNYDGSFVYNGDVQAVKLNTIVEEQGFFSKLRGEEAHTYLAGVPAGFEAVYEENEKTDTGVYYARAYVRPVDNFNYKPFEVTSLRWEIVKATPDMSRVEWNYAPFVYDGMEKVVELVNVPDGVIPKYFGNVATEAGLYEAQVSFELEDEHNFERPKPIKGCVWRIDKAKFDMSRAGWDFRDDLVYNGRKQSVEVVGLPEGVEVESYTGNIETDAGNYTAVVRLACLDPLNYEVPSIAPLRWSIKKYKINTDDMMWNYDRSSMLVYDGQLKEVKLIGVPEGIEVLYINNSKVNAGTYIAKARLSYDTKNFEVDQVPDCVWRVDKANFDTSEVYWDYDGPFTYDGMEKKITLKNVPNNIEVRYMDNRAIAIGSYTAKAYFSYNTDNYNEPAIDRKIEWEIVR